MFVMEQSHRFKGLVFGVHNMKQLKENIEIVKHIDVYLNDLDVVEELHNKFSDVEKPIMFPSLWKLT